MRWCKSQRSIQDKDEKENLLAVFGSRKTSRKHEERNRMRN